MSSTAWGAGRPVPSADPPVAARHKEPSREYPIPAAKVGEITRHRLLTGLQGPEKVMACHAPAGYGKTTLATQWCLIDERPTTWLTLRPTDNDPVLLLSRLSAALEVLERLDPEFDEALHTLSPSLDRATSRLLDRLARQRSFVLALDEVDRLTDHASLDVIRGLVSAIPPGSRLVLASRGEIAVHLARLSVAGQLWDIGAPDLAFTIGETIELFERNGINISEEDASALQTETEGWPGAIGLALMSARSSGNGVSRLSVPRRQIADYLMEEVLSQETPDIRTFLVRTSVVNRLTASLCDAITGRTDSARVLADLAMRNLFVSPIDDQHKWYRYHNLWWTFLQSQLEQSGENRNALLQRAAQWHEEFGDPGQSFRLATRARDLVQAPDSVLQRHYDDYASRGLIGSLRSWLGRCTEEDIESDPQLAIAAGWVTMLSGDFGRATRYLVAAQRHDLDGPSADGASCLRAAVTNFRAALGLGGADQILADGLSVIASERPQRTRWLVGGYRAVGAAHLILGHEQEAINAFEEVLLLTEGHPRVRHPRAFCRGCIALIYADLGQWEAAQRSVREGERESAPFEGGTLGLPHLVAQVTVQMHLQRGPESIPTLLEAIEGTEVASATPWLEAEMAIRCARLAHGIGDRKLARRALANARQACSRMEEPGVLLDRVERAQSALLQGDPVVDLLTPAERRVLSQLKTYRTLQEIGEYLHISRATVKTHVSSIYSKLGVAGRGDAVALLHANDAGPALDV